MRSIFITLAIVAVCKISYISSSADVGNDEETYETDIQDQIAKVQSFAPIIVKAVSDLSSEKVALMRPHLETLTNAFANTPIKRIFNLMSTLCEHHDDVQRMRNARRHFGQFLQQNAGRAPIKITQKTKTKLVSRSDDDDENDISGSPQDRFRKIDDSNGFARDMAMDNDLITQETMQNLQKLQYSVRAAQAQVQEEVRQANDLLHNRMREGYVQARQELFGTVNLIRSEAQKIYGNLKRAFAWLREEMRKEMRSINDELEESKRAYENNVEEFKSSIRNDLGTANEAVQQKVAQVADELKERLSYTTSELNSQLEENRNQLNDKAQRASDAVSIQVKQIREKMHAAMEEMRAEMQNVDAKLKQGIANASDGTKVVGPMNAQIRAETEKAIAEMKNMTREMREKMEKEIQNTVQVLTSEIESILKEMHAKNAEELIPTSVDTKTDNSLIKNTVDNVSTDKADSKVEKTTQTASTHQQNTAKETEENNAEKYPVEAQNSGIKTHHFYKI